MNPWPLIRAALMRYRFSALAFVLLVAAGVALSVAIVSQERALRNGSARAADKFDLVVSPPGSRTDSLLTAVFLRPGSGQLLAPGFSARLLNDTRGAFVSPLAFGDSHRGMPVVGVTAALVDHLSGGLAEGRVFSDRKESVVGATSPLRLGDRFSPSHGVHHGGERHGGDDVLDAHEVELTVVGRMRPTGSPWDRALLVPVELVWETHHLPSGHPPGDTRLGPPFDPLHTPGIPAAVVRTASLSDAYKLRRAYTGTESMAFFPAEALLQLYAVLGDVRQLMSLLAVVTQALVLMSIVASVFILFRLLMPQFVTLRALGAPRRYVFAVAWGFTASLVGMGVVCGWAGGYLLSFGIARWLAHATGVSLSPQLGMPELLMGLGILAIGLLLAALPAWRLQRMPLAGALKDY
jgi:putative ABC transport system permease protein